MKVTDKKKNSIIHEQTGLNDSYVALYRFFQSPQKKAYSKDFRSSQIKRLESVFNNLDESSHRDVDQMLQQNESKQRKFIQDEGKIINGNFFLQVLTCAGMSLLALKSISDLSYFFQLE